MAERKARSRIRRLGRFTCIAALLSLLATLAVAFAASSRFESQLAKRTLRGDWYIPAEGWPWMGIDTLGASAAYFMSTRESVAEHRSALIANVSVPEREAPWWLRFCNEERRRPSDGFGPRFWSHAFGWPLPVLSRTITPKLGGATFEHSPDSPWIAGGVYGWPTEIIWPGLIANFAFYFALFAFPPIVFSAVRTRRRRKRGGCLSCGYDRRGLPQDAPCPECGHK